MLLQAVEVRYVKSGATGNGSTWESASGSIQDMIDELEGVGGGEVWVGHGTYYPEKQLKDYYSISSVGDQYRSFFLKKNVRVFGGFKGDETKRTDRHWKDHQTVLSGHLSGGTDVLHVVVCTGDVGTARLDGFVITGGKATVKEAVEDNNDGFLFHGGHGGGVYVYETPKLVLSHLILCHNETVQGGGGIYLHESDEVLIVNTLLNRNISSYYWRNKGGTGAGLYCFGSTATLLNVTISNNIAAAYGAGLDLVKTESQIISDVKLINTIVWNNRSTSTGVDEDGNLFINNSCKLKATNSLYSYTPLANVGIEIEVDDPNTNLDVDPLFLDCDIDDYYLQETSPAINKGVDDAFHSEYSIEYDLNKRPRKHGDHIDIGAFEHVAASPVTPTAKFTSDVVSACKGLEGELKIEFTGTAPWSFTYRTSAMQSTDADIEVKNIEATPYSLPVIAGLTVTLRSVTDANSTETITGESKTVSEKPSANGGNITGKNTIQIGSTTQLTASGDAGGAWQSNNPAIASVDQNGLVAGNTTGSAEISYTVENECGEAIATFNIVVISDSKPPLPPIPDPEEPEEPEEPEPNPEPWISPGKITDVCLLETEFRIPFNTGDHKEILEYTIIFSEEAKAAGFKDIDTPEILPIEVGNIVVSIDMNIPAGVYKGEIHVYPQDDPSEVQNYPFEVRKLEKIEIQNQPKDIKEKCEGDGLVLSVEATGSNLSYQWFYNYDKIEGAILDTYEAVLSKETTGLYHVEVYNDCELINSDTVDVSMNTFAVSIKWGDVLYILDIDNKYTRFQWYNNEQPIQSNGTSIYYSNSSGLDGTYHVRAYYLENDYHESCRLTFGQSVQSSSLNIYPTILTRGNNILTVEDNEIDETYKGGMIELFTLAGQKVYSTRMSTSKMKVPITGSGSYILQVTATSGKRTVKKIFANN